MPCIAVHRHAAGTRPHLLRRGRQAFGLLLHLPLARLQPRSHPLRVPPRHHLQQELHLRWGAGFKANPKGTGQSSLRMRGVPGSGPQQGVGAGYNPGRTRLATAGGTEDDVNLNLNRGSGLMWYLIYLAYIWEAVNLYRLERLE
jgi:hypothetical protein